jgi:hypothetical protein
LVITVYKRDIINESERIEILLNEERYQVKIKILIRNLEKKLKEKE